MAQARPGARGATPFAARVLADTHVVSGRFNPSEGMADTLIQEALADEPGSDGQYMSAYDKDRTGVDSKAVDDRNVTDLTKVKNDGKIMLIALSRAAENNLPKEGGKLEEVSGRIETLRAKLDGLDKVGLALEKKLGGKKPLDANFLHINNGHKGSAHKEFKRVTEDIVTDLRALVKDVSSGAIGNERKDLSWEQTMFRLALEHCVKPSIASVNGIDVAHADAYVNPDLVNRYESSCRDSSKVSFNNPYVFLAESVRQAFHVYQPKADATAQDHLEPEVAAGVDDTGGDTAGENVASGGGSRASDALNGHGPITINITDNSTVNVTGNHFGSTEHLEQAGVPDGNRDSGESGSTANAQASATVVKPDAAKTGSTTSLDTQRRQASNVDAGQDEVGTYFRSPLAERRYDSGDDIVDLGRNDDGSDADVGQDEVGFRAASQSDVGKPAVGAQGQAQRPIPDTKPTDAHASQVQSEKSAEAPLEKNTDSSKGPAVIANEVSSAGDIPPAGPMRAAQVSGDVAQLRLSANDGHVAVTTPKSLAGGDSASASSVGSTAGTSGTSNPAASAKGVRKLSKPDQQAWATSDVANQPRIALPSGGKTPAPKVSASVGQGPATNAAVAASTGAPNSIRPAGSEPVLASGVKRSASLPDLTASTPKAAESSSADDSHVGGEGIGQMRRSSSWASLSMTQFMRTQLGESNGNVARDQGNRRTSDESTKQTPPATLPGKPQTSQVKRNAEFSKTSIAMAVTTPPATPTSTPTPATRPSLSGLNVDTSKQVPGMGERVTTPPVPSQATPMQPGGTAPVKVATTPPATPTSTPTPATRPSLSGLNVDTSKQVTGISERVTTPQAKTSSASTPVGQVDSRPPGTYRKEGGGWEVVMPKRVITTGLGALLDAKTSHQLLGSKAVPDSAVRQSSNSSDKGAASIAKSNQATRDFADRPKADFPRKVILSGEGAGWNMNMSNVRGGDKGR